MNNYGVGFMVPSILTVDSPREERDKYKPIDMRTMKDVGPKESIIITADVTKGECQLQWEASPGVYEQKVFTLGPRNMKLIPR